jgi:hypothetical protein
MEKRTIKRQSKSAKGSTPKAEVTTKTVGRPTIYSESLATQICNLIAEGMSLRKICERPDMPSRPTVFDWIAKYESFSDQYAKAKRDGSIAWAEEILEIADDGTNDYMESLAKDGDSSAGVAAYKLNGENIQRSKLRVDTRKWLLSKIQPKKYGDKVDLNHGVQPDNPITDLLAALSGQTLKPKDD